MSLIESLKQEYSVAGFIEKPADSPWLTFVKTYQFKDRDGDSKDVVIEVSFNTNHLLLPPQVRDPNNVLTSMHSINGYQCWARYSDIFPQIGLGLISPIFVEKQIEKLINAHISQEYYTVNESPEFQATFKFRNAVEHVPFFVSLETLDKVVKAGQRKKISCYANYETKISGYIVTESQKHPLAVGEPSLGIEIPNNPEGNNRRVYFFNVDYMPHIDGRIDVLDFLYRLEMASGLEQEEFYIQNIKEEIFIVVVFFNKQLEHHDIVAFKKSGDKLRLLPHARVSSRHVLFNRHKQEWSKIRNKKVAILGIGAIGSILGMTLLQSGIERLLICDTDLVDLENTTRSIYFESDIGRLKTAAFKDYATKKDCDLGQRVMALGSLQELVDSDPDLLVICIGDLYHEYYISRELKKLDFHKLVFVSGQNDCTWATIYFQDEPSLGCQQCLAYSQLEDTTLQIRHVPYFADAIGCGNPSYVSGPFDIGVIANIAGKLILERLMKCEGRHPNYFIWQSNPSDGSVKDSHTEQFSLKKFRIERHEKCDC